jgi:hypothetical protein
MARKREHRRVPVDAFCTEISGDEIRHGIVVDLSEDGLRLQRPIGGRLPSALQLEFEVPEIDEVVWARGEVRFDEVWRLPRIGDGSLSGIVRTTGIRLVTMASRQRRLLREYVMDSWRGVAPVDPGWLLDASCYHRG